MPPSSISSRPTQPSPANAVCSELSFRIRSQPPCRSFNILLFPIFRIVTKTWPFPSLATFCVFSFTETVKLRISAAAVPPPPYRQICAPHSRPSRTKRTLQSTHLALRPSPVALPLSELRNPTTVLNPQRPNQPASPPYCPFPNPF
jgi:hypothetical protein